MRNLIWLLYIVSSVLYILPNDSIAGFNISYSDIIYIIMFYFILIENTFKKNNLFYLFQKNFLGIWVILIFISIGTMLSMMKSQDPISSSTNIIQYFFIFVILLSNLIYLHDGKIKNAQKLLAITLIPYLINVILVIFSKFGYFNSLDTLIISGNGRYQGTDGIPTSFGNEIAVSSIILLYFVNVSKNLIIKLILILLFIFFIYSIILSGSFGSILIFLLSFTLFLWTGFKRKRIGQLLSIIILIVLSFLYYQIEIKQDYTILSLAPDIIESRFYKSNNNFGSSEIRGELNKYAAEDFIKNPVIGYGYGQYMYENKYSASVHNTILSAAVELGVFGLIGVILYLVYPLTKTMYLFKTKIIYDKEIYRLILYLFVYSCSRIFMTISSQEYVNRPLWIPILLIFSISFYHVKKNKE